jgi:hypothetical protein
MNFTDIYAQLKDKKMSFKTSYNLRRLAASTEEHMSFYYDELQKIINTYGDRDENGNLVLIDDNQAIKIKQESLPECQSKINELLLTPVDIPYMTFAIEDLENFELTPAQVGFFMNFIS